MRKVFTLISFMIVQYFAYSQHITQKDIDSNFIQNWILVSVQINNKPTLLNEKQRNLHARFSRDSTYTSISDKATETGKWHYDYSKQILILNDGKGDDPEMKVKIEKLTEKECVLVISEANAGVTKLFLHKSD